MPAAGREVGPASAAVIDELMEVNAMHRLRCAQGIIALRTTVGTPGWKRRATGP